MKLSQFLLFSVFLLISNLSVASITEKITEATNGTGSNGNSHFPDISSDGRYVTFSSAADNLVPEDTNEDLDIFVHDRNTRKTNRISIDSSGDQGNHDSDTPIISANGRFVTFRSASSNLVEADTNGKEDIFIHDLETSTTERIGENQGNGDSAVPAISADGRYVTFLSNSSNLVTGDTNGFIDAFVYDRNLGTTERVSIDSSGNQGNESSGFGTLLTNAPAISDDGRYVSFSSLASNLVTNDSNGFRDIFVHDRDTGTTERVSISSSGNQGSGHSDTPAISADGRYVAFQSAASNLVTGDSNEKVDIFIHDRITDTTERVSIDSSGEQLNQDSGGGVTDGPDISADGRYVSFPSTVRAIQNILVHDRDTGTTEILSVDPSGNRANEFSFRHAISADGQFVTFSSEADNLVTNDLNQGIRDIFVVRTSDIPVISTRIAQYQSDFSNPQAIGWLYQWNADVPIGQSEGYVDMQWDRWKYDSDGLPGLPDTSGLAYGHFSASGGHPGQGTLDGELHDRYVIAGFMIDETGEYTINNSQIIHNGCEFGNGGVVDIYVDDNLIDSFTFESENETSFDNNVGLVDSGSIIYVAVGPNGKDNCDGFDWDYAIERVSSVPANQPPTLNNPGNQTSKIGDNIQLLLNGSDPDGDVLSFGASGLPIGLGIDSQSGLISGTVSSSSLIGTHNVSVTVDDNQGESHTISFDWTVNPASMVVARYRSDFTNFTDPQMNGWLYQWNADGPIGQSENYVDMQWDRRGKYDSDGVKGLPDDSGLAYGNFDLGGGHPGRGTLQGEANDRYVIAGYTVDTTGEYQINNSYLTNNSCTYGNGGIVKVYVNNNLIDSINFDAGGNISFDINLGMVDAGSTIYVALGANGEDGCDGFSWDYEIELN